MYTGWRWQFRTCGALGGPTLSFRCSCPHLPVITRKETTKQLTVSFAIKLLSICATQDFSFSFFQNLNSFQKGRCKEILEMRQIKTVVTKVVTGDSGLRLTLLLLQIPFGGRDYNGHVAGLKFIWKGDPTELNKTVFYGSSNSSRRHVAKFNILSL